MAILPSPPPLSDLSDWQVMQQESPVKIRQAELRLGLLVGGQAISEGFYDLTRVAGSAQHPANLSLELTGVPELTGTMPVRIKSWEVNMGDYFYPPNTGLSCMEVTFEGLDWLPKSATSLTQSQLKSIADEVTEDLPESLPNREFMQKLAIASAQKGARLMAECLKAQLSEEK